MQHREDKAATGENDPTGKFRVSKGQFQIGKFDVYWFEMLRPEQKA
jgi:hypothetical protein